MSSEGSPRRAATVTVEGFRRACGRFASGVTVATCVDAGGLPHGLTVSSFSSVSLAPPLVLICLDRSASIIEQFRAASYFGINVLADDQRDLSDRFARKLHNRFEGVNWRRGETGVPLLPGVLAEMECAVNRRVAAGDHDIFIGQMVRSHVAEGHPLIHFASRYRRLE